MATLKEQVEGLTSLTIGTTPTTSEFETFLADGVKDVVDRLLQFKPDLTASFAKTTAMTTDDGLDLGGAKVLGVVRETEADVYRVAEPMNLNKRFILLLPLTTLEGITRYNIFKNNKISIVILNKRVNFIENKSNFFNSSWFLGNIYDTNKIFFQNVPNEPSSI